MKLNLWKHCKESEEHYCSRCIVVVTSAGGITNCIVSEHNTFESMTSWTWSYFAL
jgi:hypothetical protein